MLIKEWLDNPAVVEQSCAYSRPVMTAPDGSRFPYNTRGRPFCTAREACPLCQAPFFPNAMNVQLQIGDIMYPFLETEKDVDGGSASGARILLCASLRGQLSGNPARFLSIGYGFSRPVNYIEVGPVPEFYR